MRSTTFYLLFEGMLNVGTGSFNVYMLNMLNALLNVGVYVLLFTCKTHIGVMLQFSHSVFSCCGSRAGDGSC